MSFLKRLFGGRSTASVDPRPDSALHYERIPEFRNYLLKGQFDAFSEGYRSLTWDAQSLLIEGLTSDPELDGPVQDWAEAQPAAYLAHLLCGTKWTRIAWEIRTNQLAEKVTEEQALGFLVQLKQARAALLEAGRLNTTDALVPARMLPVLMGLEEPTETAMTYFEAARALRPSHLGAHLSMLLFLTPKWHGSLEEMQDFVDRYADGETYPLLTVVRLSALLEEWGDLQLNGDQEGFKAFFADEGRRAYIRGLYDRFREPAEGRLLVPIVRNWFALLLLKSGALEQARQEIRAIKGKMSTSPWRNVGITSYEALTKF